MRSEKGQEVGVSKVTPSDTPVPTVFGLATIADQNADSQDGESVRPHLFRLALGEGKSKSFDFKTP